MLKLRLLVSWLWTNQFALSQVFLRMQLRQTHTKEKHPDYFGKFICIQCQSQFKSRQQLYQHRMRAHEPLGEFWCSFCDSVWSLLCGHLIESHVSTRWPVICATRFVYQVLNFCVEDNKFGEKGFFFPLLMWWYDRVHYLFCLIAEICERERTEKTRADSFWEPQVGLQFLFEIFIFIQRWHGSAHTQQTYR